MRKARPLKGKLLPVALCLSVGGSIAAYLPDEMTQRLRNAHPLIAAHI